MSSDALGVGAMSDGEITRGARSGVPALVRRWSGVITAALGCLVYLAVRPATIDFASGDFRARLAQRGAYVWNNLWFAGHALPAYGIIPPWLSAHVGVLPVAIASILVASLCTTLLVEHCRRTRPQLPTATVTNVLLGAGIVLSLWAGRLTFGPSIAFAAATLLALQRRRPRLATIAAVGCGLSSPVGVVCLVIVLAGCWAAGALDRRHTVVAVVAALVPPVALGVAFPEGGWYPFSGRGLCILVMSSAVVAAAGWREPVVRWTAVMYAGAAVAAFALRTPLGGNIARLGWLAAGPAAVFVVARHRRILVPTIAAISLMWGWSYAKMAFQPADRTNAERFYDPLADYVHSLSDIERVEVVPTSTFRQADELALEINLARGWDTQLDRKYNPELYDAGLDAARFHQWLRANAISLVALPIGPLQHAAHFEVDVIRSRPDYLQTVWSDRNWQVYRVVDPTPLATNGARLIDVAPESLTIDAPAVGTAMVRFHYSSLYRVDPTQACLTASPGGWIEVHVRRPGRIRLRIDVSATGLVGRSDATC